MDQTLGKIYDAIYGLVLPLLFFVSLILTVQAGIGGLSRYQGKPGHRTARPLTQDPIQRPDRSFFHDSERYDVIAVLDGRNATTREVVVRRASTGQVKSWHMGDRLFDKGPFVATIEKDRVFFWMDGRTRKISLKPQ